ncbi:Predicted arabinose efflux permease, MFS family [Evansella caseinilytica]|uniref:Predicted arabinose efflux permease, MFS family n=1 Tax=Evansella caseinilytica TaxID=1503961 RepID=A0A1H3K1T5_9BACI|nr:MFS transporter [Evansella caseinilytica]SDY46147.1 Predicted arabinose efflux permease, MFS family [Evansella caseinilytica]
MHEIKHRAKQKNVLFLILFLLFFSIHMQFPVFTPLAVSLGAGSFLVGLMLSATSFVNLGGNLIAGTYIDKYGTKWFIIIPLFLLSASLFAHTMVEEAGHLFILRVVNGFILAFLTPACMTMLASFAKTSQQQSRNMAMNTFMVTTAMCLAPVAGGWTGERFGSDGAYFLIGLLTFFAFLLAAVYLSDQRLMAIPKNEGVGMLSLLSSVQLFPAFLTAFAIMFAQGTLMYELPFLSVENDLTKEAVGKLAGLMGIGTLFVLSFVFLHRLTAKVRIVAGLCLMASALGWMMLAGSVPPVMSMVLFGVASGIVYPAMMTLVTENIHEGSRGKAFAFLSAVFSVGTISSPFIAGLFRQLISPYFLAWFVIMGAVTMIGYQFLAGGVPKAAAIRKL